MHSLPHYEQYQKGTFVTTAEPTLTRHDHTKSVLCHRVTFGGAHSLGLEHIMMRICHYNITLSVTHCPGNPPAPTPPTTDTFTVYRVLPFPEWHIDGIIQHIARF